MFRTEVKFLARGSCHVFSLPRIEIRVISSVSPSNLHTDTYPKVSPWFSVLFMFYNVMLNCETEGTICQKNFILFCPPSCFRSPRRSLGLDRFQSSSALECYVRQHGDCCTISPCEIVTAISHISP